MTQDLPQTPDEQEAIEHARKMAAEAASFLSEMAKEVSGKFPAHAEAEFWKELHAFTAPE